MNQTILHTKTVILGAGISGISCGINLLKNNYTDFLVFEPLERIGGRICTQTNGKIAFIFIFKSIGVPFFAHLTYFLLKKLNLENSSEEGVHITQSENNR